jgi:hypothetical protein
MHNLLVTRSADELGALFFARVQRARLFGPAIFEASKLKVLFVGVEEANSKHPGKLPRTYTLTHSDVTARLTLAVSHTIHAAQLQGWYNRLQRDEVVAEWKKVRGAMSLHVHCHISGGHFLLDLIAPLRYYIFRKELPVVGYRRWTPFSTREFWTTIPWTNSVSQKNVQTWTAFIYVVSPLFCSRTDSQMKMCGVSWKYLYKF